MGIVYFCTSNDKKWRELHAILTPHLPAGTDLRQAKVDLPELQGTPSNIATQKCLMASQKLPGQAVITEDTSLGFDDMQGLPGPYVKCFLDGLGVEGLAHLAQSYSGKLQPPAKATCILAFYDPNTMAEPLLFVGCTEGVIVTPRGPPTSFGWDPIFQPSTCAETYGEMPEDVKNAISHRSRSLHLLIQYFAQEKQEDGPTENRTPIAGFKVPSATDYTIGPL
jgi:inosine triphosphate pyrophosphatase